MTTKTEQAIELIEKEGLTVRKAARQVDVSESAVHAALKKHKAKEQGVCPACGQHLATMVTDEDEICWCVLYEDRTWKAYPTKREAEDALSNASDKPLYMIQVIT